MNTFNNFSANSTMKKNNPPIDTRRAVSCIKIRRSIRNDSRFSSPVKNLDTLVSRCEKELKKIKKISGKLLKSRRIIQKNNEIIENFIHRPLFSVKVLSKERPKFLNRNFKYQN
jgi:hypothetical protein